MDRHNSKLNGTVFSIHDWLSYLRDQSAKCRGFVGRADDDHLIKSELLALASVCDEIADNIEDHAPRGPISKPS